LLVNPYQTPLPTVEDSRVIVEEGVLNDFVGAEVQVGNPNRRWFIQHFLLPITTRRLGGIRAKVEDQKGFVSFINQRDLEVLLGIELPGEACYWWGSGCYAAPGDDDWVGLAADEDDLLDDLYEWELHIRSDLQQQGYYGIPEGVSFTRYLHDSGTDYEETWVFLWDTGTDFKNLTTRWSRAERKAIIWSTA